MKFNKLLNVISLATLLVVSSQSYAVTDQNEMNNKKSPAASASNGESMHHGDPFITSSLEDVLRQSKMLSNANIKVHTVKGVVHLKGVVDSDTEFSTAVMLAESIIGVKDVDTSKLEVKGSQKPMADALITAKIKGLFIREKLFGEKDIAAINTSVETKDGVVYLSGNVDNNAQIENAIHIIKKSIPEVKKVEYNVIKPNH